MDVNRKVMRGNARNQLRFGLHFEAAMSRRNHAKAVLKPIFVANLFGGCVTYSTRGDIIRSGWFRKAIDAGLFIILADYN